MWRYGGELVEEQGGFVKIGHLTTDDINFTFRWGPGVIQSTVPTNTENLVLVLNGRAPEKISTAKQWIHYLKKYPRLKHTIIVLLGDEQCNNSWIVPYLRSNGGPIDAVFLVYDSTLVDDVEVFQWPLGVATYRGFPDYSKGQSIDLTSPRSHLCNFLGTVYHNSSRQVLVQILESPKLQDECIVRGRDKWTPLETEESLNFYINAISKSDLTLNPVGFNTECYRIYEALALGSIPVVENVVTHGSCDHTLPNAPLRLLKKYKAPLILVKNWRELHEVLLVESQRTLAQKVERRLAAVRWIVSVYYDVTIKETLNYGKATASSLSTGFVLYVVLSIVFYSVATYWRVLPWQSRKLLSTARRVMFVIAHPDDECMFFGPVIMNLSQRSDCEVYLLCLSKGNYDKEGGRRKKELWESCRILGIPDSNITLIMSTLLPDNPKVKWREDILSSLILHHVEALSIDTIITFDKHGVSNHANHCSLFYAMALLCIEKKLPKNCHAFALETTSILRKYSYLLDVPISYLMSSNNFVVSFQERATIKRAMQAHASQLLWFRHLYLFFSRYLFINSLQEIEILDLELDLELDDE
ncbi:Ribitol-5-phosphate xylosyltransferase 1 [Frankliniella fusca]|uniref:N-acetylglucosaminylphosphatidylinositol deacetylase n=1 Tax=Frankliniella fusca TaxID=407009 RepID=A0AAE1LPC3_9NEOP|nr:Ribitol-5-phosphate xylosyltransferase 1 [Frankliniella fusca]